MGLPPVFKKSAAMDLLPALALLKGLYESGRDRISKLNAREKQTKLKCAKKEAESKATIARIETRFRNHEISEAFRVNETWDENHFGWGYFQKACASEHRQFHNGLAIQHGT